MSWRLRDPTHYSPEACLNVDQLALCYAMNDDADANMCLQVGPGVHAPTRLPDWIARGPVPRTPPVPSLSVLHVRR